MLRMWRPAGTAVAVGLALLLTWHVINGKHGLQVWHQKRAEDQQLRKEIDELQQENAKLHYAKPGEVIYTLPAPALSPAQGPVGSGK